jgi:hypothetical protein
VTVSTPKATLLVREHRGQPFYEAFWRFHGKQVKRRIGPAWLERDSGSTDWRRRRGRVQDEHYDEASAHVAAAQLVAKYVSDAADRERVERERRSRGVTFREVAQSYMRWLSDVAGAKPSTLRDRESVLGEAGVPVKRGKGTTCGHVMAALGDRPASKITTREVNDVLATVSATGASASTVNKYRAVSRRCSTTAVSLRRSRCPTTRSRVRTSAASQALVRSSSTPPPRSRRLPVRSRKVATAIPLSQP